MRTTPHRWRVRLAGVFTSLCFLASICLLLLYIRSCFVFDGIIRTVEDIHYLQPRDSLYAYSRRSWTLVSSQGVWSIYREAIRTYGATKTLDQGTWSDWQPLRQRAHTHLPAFLAFGYRNNSIPIPSNNAFIPTGESGDLVLYFPQWLLLAASLTATALALRRYHRLRAAHRLAAGLCPRCAYDLRATPTHCPECGHKPRIPAPPTSVTPVTTNPPF